MQPGAKSQTTDLTAGGQQLSRSHPVQQYPINPINKQIIINLYLVLSELSASILNNNRASEAARCEQEGVPETVTAGPQSSIIPNRSEGSGGWLTAESKRSDTPPSAHRKLQPHSQLFRKEEQKPGSASF